VAGARCLDNFVCFGCLVHDKLRSPGGRGPDGLAGCKPCRMLSHEDAAA
jgi:hypothetical protein